MPGVLVRSSNLSEELAGPARSRFIGLCALFLGAAIVRVAVVQTARSYLLPNVWYEYGQIAANLVTGRGFSIEFLGMFGPTASQAPVYPSLVAIAYLALGVQNAAAALWLQLIQAVLGAWLPLLVAAICWRMVPERPVIGWLAGWTTALHPTLVYAVTHLQPITLLSLEAALLIHSGLSLTELGPQPVARTVALKAVFLGLLGGLTLLTDPILGLVFFVAILTALCWRPPQCNRATPLGVRLRAIVIAASVAVLLPLPWLVRNYAVFGRFIPIKSTFGYAFWQGNHPRSWGTDKIPRAEADDLVAMARGGLRELTETLWKARHETRYIDDMVLTPSERQRLATLSEPERCQFLLHAVLDYIRHHPDHYVRLCLQRLRYFLLFDETNPRTRLPAYRAYHALFVALSLLGLWRGRQLWRRLWPLPAAYAAVCLFHTLTIVSIRFRLPVEAFQAVYAAIGIIALLRPAWLTGSRTAPQALAAVDDAVLTEEGDQDSCSKRAA